MIRGRLKCAQSALALAVFLLPLVAFGLAAIVRFARPWLPHYSADVDPHPYFVLLLLATVLWAVFAEHYGLNAVDQHLLHEANVRRVSTACFLTYLAILATTFFYREIMFSRIFVWLSAITLFALTLATRAVFRAAWLHSRARSRSAAQVLIVGADQFAQKVAASLVSDSVAPCAIKGHLRLPDQANVITDSPVYEFSGIPNLAMGNGIDDLVLAIPPSHLENLAALRRELSAICAPMRLVLNIGEPLDGRQRLFTHGNLLLLDLQSTPAESVLYIVLKRAFDLCFSAAVLILGAPVFALIALLVRLSSPGPVIFTQERVGLNGALFRMYKFRTMRVSSPSESNTRWTVKNDPRCTAIGRILRRTGLDELPQFFNVLKGEMSVVGPRPERPVLVQQFMQSVGNYNRRHYLRVGITGWAQVNGWRGDTSIEKRVEYDLYYVRHWTLAFDLLIVLLTLLRGFTSKNAY
jgi:Undecaprenyl-phosphate glucose phosphotransferase